MIKDKKDNKLYFNNAKELWDWIDERPFENQDDLEDEDFDELCNWYCHKKIKAISAIWSENDEKVVKIVNEICEREGSYHEFVIV